MELTLVPLLLPIIQHHHLLSVRQLAWFFNSYSIAVAFGVLLGGWVGDIFGVRRVFGIGVAMFAIGAVVVAFAQGYPGMITGRALQGFGGGFFSPLVPVMLTSALPMRPGKILVIWGSITGYCAAFAPLAMGPAVSVIGWQTVFVLFAALAGIALYLTGQNTSGEPIATRRMSPGLRPLLGAYQLWFVFGYVFCTYGAITLYLFELPFRLTDIGFGAVAIGGLLAVMWFSFSVVGTFMRNTVDGPHLHKIVYAAPLLIFAGFLAGWYSDQVTFLVLSAAFLGAGFACGNAPSTLLVLKFAPEDLKAFSTSLDITFARLGGVAAVGLLAWMNAGNSVLVVACLSFVAAGLALMFSRGTNR